MIKAEKQDLAEKIAQLLTESDSEQTDAAFFRASLEKIDQRLEKIESQITSQSRHPALGTQHFTMHPSQERFLNIEEIADEIIDKYNNEKPCPYEPTAKPCDNCSMCSSRGF